MTFCSSARTVPIISPWNLNHAALNAIARNIRTSRDQDDTLARMNATATTARSDGHLHRNLFARVMESQRV
jgi:hypothetical protein